MKNTWKYGDEPTHLYLQKVHLTKEVSVWRARITGTNDWRYEDHSCDKLRYNLIEKLGGIVTHFLEETSLVGAA